MAIDTAAQASDARLMAQGSKRMGFEADLREINNLMSDPTLREADKEALRATKRDLYRKAGFDDTAVDRGSGVLMSPGGVRSLKDMGPAERAEHDRIYARLRDEPNMPRTEREQLLARKSALYTGRA